MELNSLAFGPIGKSFFQHMLMDSHLRFLSPLIVDGQSLPYVQGSTIDFVDGLQGAGFKVDNPNVIAACGCGSSFRVADEEEVSAV